MKTSRKTFIAAVISAALMAAFLAACSDAPPAEMASKYTEQTARAIIDGSWKIAGSIVLGAVINGLLR